MDEPGKIPIEKEQKQVNRIYAAMVAMVIFSCVPLAVFQMIGVALLFYVMIGAYVLRMRYPEDSMVNNHMTYLIRTFWISSMLFGIGFLIAAAYLAQKLDLNAINAMTGTLMSGKFVLTDEVKVLTVVSLVTMGPSLIYFVYRVAKGLSRALHGHRMGNVKEWL